MPISTPLSNAANAASQVQLSHQLAATDNRAEIVPSPTSFLGRLWCCITRSSHQVAENKSIARQFIEEIRSKYGDPMACMASRELSSHLNRGSPLSVRRAKVILDHAARLTERMVADVVKQSKLNHFSVDGLRATMAKFPGTITKKIVQERIDVLEKTHRDLMDIAGHSDKKQFIAQDALSTQIRNCLADIATLQELLPMVPAKELAPVYLDQGNTPEIYPMSSS